MRICYWEKNYQTKEPYTLLDENGSLQFAKKKKSSDWPAEK